MQNGACRSRLKFSSLRAWFPKNGNQGSLWLYTMLGVFFRMGCNLPLWPTGKVIGKTCPFREILVKRKGRGQTGRGYYGKSLKRSGGNYIVCINFVYYNIIHCDLWSTKFVQESYTHACFTQVTDLLSWWGVLTFGDHEFTSITQLQPTNLQDTACRIELANLGLKFPLVKSILLPALLTPYVMGSHIRVTSLPHIFLSGKDNNGTQRCEFH